MQNDCVWWGVSCKHPLTWWITPVVVAPGINFTDTWGFIRLFSLNPSIFLMMESPTIRVSFLPLLFLLLFSSVLFSVIFYLLISSLVLIKVVLSVTCFVDDVSSLYLFILLCVELLVVSFDDLTSLLRFQLVHLDSAPCSLWKYIEILRFHYKKYRDVANFVYLYFEKKKVPCKSINSFIFELVFLYQIVDELFFLLAKYTVWW